MKKILIAILLLITSVCFANEFEGKISIVKKTHSDTIYYNYSVKSNKIRIDELDKNNSITQTYIINTQDSSVFVINYNEKAYKKLNTSTEYENKSNIEIINTGIFKYINGYKCYQWRVRDVSKNSEIAYWLAEGNFNFFSPIAKFRLLSEDILSYYSSLLASTNAIPLLVEHRTILRDEKATYAVSNIDKSPINDATFLIPKAFKFYKDMQ